METTAIFLGKGNNEFANDPLNMKINFSIDFRCVRVAFDWFVFFFTQKRLVLYVALGY